ncbi:glycine zipper 2TM domain-containing protein [Sphingomonas paeninsulae]|jgi:uncharacterized protein YcfJ|nr:glycine zipper 2TM domain-containing protein [Sphingomonas paeninsulae]
MRKMIMVLSAVAMIAPTLAISSPAEARRHYRERDGRHDQRYCTRNNGTTGLIVGGVGGALLGRAIDTRGDRAVGTIGGAALGALAGRAIDRGGSRRCR